MGWFQVVVKTVACTLEEGLKAGRLGRLPLMTKRCVRNEPRQPGAVGATERRLLGARVPDPSGWRAPRVPQGSGREEDGPGSLPFATRRTPAVAFCCEHSTSKRCQPSGHPQETTDGGPGGREAQGKGLGTGRFSHLSISLPVWKLKGGSQRPVRNNRAGGGDKA